MKHGEATVFTSVWDSGCSRNIHSVVVIASVAVVVGSTSTPVLVSTNILVVADGFGDRD